MSSTLGIYEEHKDLKLERSRSTFRVTELTNFLEGSAEKTAQRKELEKLFYDDIGEKQKDPIDYLTHDEMYEEALSKAHKIYFKAMELSDPREVLAIADGLHHEASPLLVHFVMFIPGLMGHATEEQQEKWLGDAIELKITGTYAQTELGHGTYLKGLETTATYDPQTQEFVLNSPTLSSIKWWPGGLGKTANWAIVLAQLWSQGICRGVHPFMVQLRDMQTHEPLPGIQVGEIGPKMGLKAADNGFLKLNNLRIPRDHMLMKNARVEPNGDYIKPKSQKLNYGTMVFVRVVIIDMVAYNLARALTIAIRYSAIRRQAEIQAGKGEVQILDYQAQQYKLFPLISMAHAFKATFVYLMASYRAVTEDIERGQLSTLAELHAISSGLKALGSELASMGIEKCRMACGGHGFMLVSGLPRLYASTVAACTYEGENTVLYLQTARYLLKVMANKEDNLACGYLAGRTPPRVTLNGNIQDLQALLTIFQASAYRLVHLAASRVQKMSTVASPEEAWVASHVDLIAGARAHIVYFLLSKYINWVESARVSRELHAVLYRLCYLLIYHFVVDAPGHFLLAGLSSNDLSAINNRMLELLSELRPDAVAVVDAFDFHDVVLMSALGCRDGRAYERLFDLAKRAPLNRREVHPAYKNHILSLRSKL